MMNSLVTAPAIAAPVQGLLSAGNRVTTDDGSDWENGVTFTPRGCYVVHGRNAGYCPPSDISAAQECHPPVSFEPYVLDLGALWNSADRFDIKALVTDDFEIGTSSRLERLIWAGATDNDSPTLADGAAVGAAATPRLALGAIAAALVDAEDHIGARGTIHLSPQVAMQTPESFTYIDGVLYTTIGGHKVVVGNYPATHIAAHIGDIDVYLGEPFVVEAVDEVRRANVQTFQVQRLALATWNTCASFLQPVTL